MIKENIRVLSTPKQVENLPPALVLFGPTASGKTSVGIELANKLNGIIINIDSRQLYRHMPIITACPSAGEYSSAEHKMFEILEPNELISAAKYAELAYITAKNITDNGKLPIFVGGTGFYIDAIVNGLSPVPQVPSELIAKLNDNILHEGLDSLCKQLHPQDTKVIDIKNPHRVVRALSVFIHTKKPLSYWQGKPREGALPYKFIKLAINPDRQDLYDRISKRTSLMIDSGIIDEIATLKKSGYTCDMPGLKSLGVDMFYKHIEGKTELDDVLSQYNQSQRRYAKRQLTWLNNSYNAQVEFFNVQHAISNMSSIKSLIK